jgi:hypothetical protein
VNPTATVALSHPAVRLSDPVTATVAVVGPAPLVVTVPDAILQPPSMEAWKVQPAGPATVEKLPDGTERWTRSYRLDPYTPGAEVPLTFAPLGVSAGGESYRVEVPATSVAVTTAITDPSAAAARPVTAPEYPPPPPPDRTAMVAAVAVLVVVLMFGIWRLARRRRPSLTPAEVAVPRIDALAAEWAAGRLSATRFAAELADAVRQFVQTTHRLPADRRTTAELLAAVDPDKVPMAELESVLSAGDRAKFAEIGPVDGDRLLAEARRVIVGPAMPDVSDSPRPA